MKPPARSLLVPPRLLLLAAALFPMLSVLMLAHAFAKPPLPTPAAINPAPERIEVHGHRGARARLPENSLPAFEHALAVGANYLELDLGVTKDDVLIVSHDRRLNPDICLGQDGQELKSPPLIRSLTLTELQTYDCGARVNPRFASTQRALPGTRMPTLQQVFDLARESRLPAARKVRFNIETKIRPDAPGDTVDPAAFARLLHAVVKKNRLEDRVVVQSFDYRTLKEYRKLSPKAVISALTEDETADWAKIIEDTRANILSPDLKLVTPERVRLAHEAGVKVIPWTANDAQAWRKLLGARVDGIITDDPEALIAFLKKPRS